VKRTAGANADLVVTTLDDVSLAALVGGRLEQGSIRMTERRAWREASIEG